jgi:hypothetical protein
MTLSVSRIYSIDRNRIHIKAFYMIFDPKRKLSVIEGFHLYVVAQNLARSVYEKDM